MKNFAKLLSIAAMVLCLGACGKDNVDYKNNNNENSENIGYLALGNMEATIMEDTENIDSETRAEGVDINTFDVVITDQAGQTVDSFKYGECPAEPIALEAGIYKITTMSEEMGYREISIFKDGVVL